jgi:plastocyanin
MRRALLLAALLLALGAAPGGAAEIPVTTLFQSFSPSLIDALPGDDVVWTNASERTHTVTADGGSFDSGDLAPGAAFGLAAGDPGAYTYHCTIHAGMTGELDVWRVILAPLPPAAVPAGELVELSGRTATAQPVAIERDAGSGFHQVARAIPAPDGSWSVSLPAETTADYRAASGIDTSRVRRLLVLDRRIEITPTRRGIHVTITPQLPYGRLLLERRLRERFGWYPIARKRLDYLSRASFRFARPATIRVSLVDRDGWTPLATSPVVHLRRPR